MFGFTCEFRRVLVLVVATLLTCVALAGAGGEVRTWTDTTGKFKIEGKFLSENKGKVTLQRTSGLKFEIDLNRLSVDDQKYVAEQAKKQAENPFKEAAEDPFKAKPETSAGPAKQVAVDWTNARRVDLVPASTGWKITVKPAAEAKLKPAPVGLPPKADFFERTKALVVSPASPRAVLGYQLDRGGKATSRVVLCDLDQAKVVSQENVPGKMVPVALHDDGTQVLLKRDESGWGNSDRLELWTLAANGNAKTMQFTPYDDQQRGDRDIRWAAFLDEKRLITANGGGKLAVWDLPTARPLYYLMIQGDTVPALSPDRKLLAFTTGKEVGILDLDAGKVLALQPSPNNTPFAVLSFSPGGKWLACSAFDRLFVWDAATGALTREISTKGIFVAGQMYWTSDRHLLLGNKALFDTDMQILLWDYQNQEQAQPAGGLTWFLVHDFHTKQAAPIPASLPHPTAEQALQKASEDPNFIVLRAGTTVKLDVSGLADAAEREKVAAALTARLQKNGCKVGPDGTIELVAVTELGKERELAFYFSSDDPKFGPKGFPGGFGPKGSLPAGTKLRHVKMQEHIARLKFVFQGKTVWESSSLNIPHDVQLEEGETLEQNLRKRERPNYAFYQSVELPRLLLHSSGSAALGTSRVTLTGVQ